MVSQITWHKTPNIFTKPRIRSPQIIEWYKEFIKILLFWILILFRNAIIVPLANCVTSFFAGFVIFAYMGYLSHITGQNIDDIIQAGNLSFKC